MATVSKDDTSDNSNSSSSSPPPSSSSSPPPPPSSSPSSPSPPPPSSSSSSSSPPPPSSSSSSPPPSSPPPPKDNDEDNNGNSSASSSPPPPPKNSNHSPPPPKSDDNNDSSNNNPPPPPPPPPPPSSSHHWRGSPPPSIDSGKSGLSQNDKAIIAGVCAGAGLLLIVMIVFCVACCKKKKRRRDNYYMDNSNGRRSDGYYNNSGQHGNWAASPNKDHALKIPPPPSQYSSGPWTAAAPPPPPPMMSSSEISSANFSGQVPLPPPHPSLALGFNKSSFTYEDLAAATGGFTKENLLGQGGFGYVHKGVLPNGKEIAVKSLKSGSGQGEREFQAEVDIISRVHHRHLVSLVGYCIADAQRMLVYEFVPNNSLEHHLYGKSQPVMDFSTRLKIALGSAKGFAYLHEDCHPRIIHRDIKAANILLDYNYEAKVADFGLAKLSNDNHTHVSTRIMGTFGYLAPEYASSGKLTEKSDVYSYGVVLLELITGKHPVDLSSDDDSLVDWARPILLHVTDGGSYEELIDPRLENNYNPQEMLRMVACAAACIRHSARRRPKMSQVVRALEGDASLEDLNEAVKPGHSNMFGSSGSSEYDGYGSGMKKFKTRGANISSQEFSSSEHGLTGEFPIHASPSSSGDSHEIRSNASRRHSP